MLPDQRASFILRAMTLCGVGSYLKGSRLEFKPLTVICGANGSGKSTWLKALNVLKNSLEAKTLPYGFSVSDWDPNNIDFTNAFYHLASPADVKAVSSDVGEEMLSLLDFGSPGTVGLEIECDNTAQLGIPELQADPSKSLAWNFLWAGMIPARTRIRLRVAHPTYWADSDATPHLKHEIELQINDSDSINLVGERDPLQRFEDGFAYPRRSKPYSLYASPSFIKGDGQTLRGWGPVATIYDLNSVRLTTHINDLDHGQASKLLRMFEHRFCEILKRTLDGYFYIGAIRNPHTTLQSTPTRDPTTTSCTSNRHVGSSGEYAWHREAGFDSAEMSFDVDFPCTFESCDIDVGKFLKQFSPENRDCSFDEIPESEHEVGEYPLSFRGLSHIWDWAEPSLRAEVELLQSIDCVESESVGATCAELLNSTLDNAYLFDETSLYTLSVSYDQDTGEKQCQLVIEDRVMEFYANLNSGTLSPKEIRQRNCAFILYFLSVKGEGVKNERWRCRFSAYVNQWVSHLSGISIQPAHLLGASLRYNQWTVHAPPGQSQIDRPPPFLVFAENFLRMFSNDKMGQDVKRLIVPSFGTGLLGTIQPPRQLSAGFHQVFPIIVQLGLMRQEELVAIENPEVHLHPSLQIRVTEMLISHARSGRHILVETHSDLVVRRIMRCLLKEELPQSAVRLYFSSMKQTARCSPIVEGEASEIAIDFHGSSLETLAVDERGRILNWPEGFLDEDLHESQRLLDIMYGNAREIDSDGE